MIEVFYDGECIFCQSYVKLKQLRKKFGTVKLISIREEKVADEVKKLVEQGYTLNLGMIVRHNNTLYYGAEAMAFLGSFSQGKTTPTKQSITFRWKRSLFKVLYPILVFGRYITLFLLGRSLFSTKAQHYIETKKEPTYKVLRLSLVLFLLISIGSYGFALLLTMPDLPHLFQNTFTALGLPKKYTDIQLINSVVEYLNKINIQPSLSFWGTVFAFTLTFIAFFKENWILRYCHDLIKGHIWPMVLSLAILLIAVNFHNFIPIRRIIFGVLCLPLLPLSSKVIHHLKAKGIRSFVPAFFIILLAVVTIVPGFYFPPFFDGISGWVATPNKEKIDVWGYRIINKKGEKTWYSHTLLNPVTQKKRFSKTYQLNIGKDNYFDFLMENYKRLFPLLKQKRLPHQRYFTFGYPSHTQVGRNEDYRNFPPEDIVEIQEVVEHYDLEGNFIDSELRTSKRF